MVLIQNKDIFRNYEILEKFESGLQLKGFEVKALFEGKGSLKGAYVTKRDNELFLVNFYIPPYQEKNVEKNYNPYRERKLLLHKKEINYLIQKLKQPGITILPLRIYNKNRLIKVEIALVKGLKKYEKKEKIKEKEFKRKRERVLKSWRI